ncbi:MAG: hypothetical protein R8K53_04120, partial [Mariprofundaceae bacterium]
KTKKAIEAGMASGKAGPRSILATGNVHEIKTACKKAKPAVRVIYDPNLNIAHSLIVNIPEDDMGMREALAADVFCDSVQLKDIQ